MRIKDLFDYKYGVNLELINCEITDELDNSVNFVSRTSENNGVVARVRIIPEVQTQKAGTISLAVSGSVLSCFVQTQDYYSGRDLYVLIPKVELSLEEKLFYSMSINKNAYRYSYGRAANKTFPEIEIPDIDLCRSIIKNYRIKPIITNNTDIKILTTKWKEFKISDLFETNSIRGQLSSLTDISFGETQVISTTEKNNGVVGYYDVDAIYENSITVSFNGSCGFFSFHEKPFNCTSDVGVLKPKFKLNKYNALFLVTVLNKLSFKYQYGRKLNGQRLKNEIIVLPETEGFPDFELMESIIRKLPYADII
jgi:hypothetical protein